MFDNKIQYFITVVEQGSFSAAARKLYVSQPALSKQVRILENELGLLLLDRSGYRPVLTKAGQQYYENVCRLKDDYQNILEQISQEALQHIRIAYTGSEANRDALIGISKMKRDFTNVEISLVNSTFDELRDRLLADEVDISLGIELMFQDLEDIAYEVIFPNEMYVICSFDHPLSEKKKVEVQDLKDESLIIFSRQYGKKYYKAFAEHRKQANLHVKAMKEVPTFSEMMTEVSIGNGVAIVSKDVINPQYVRAIPLSDTHFKSQYVIAYQKQKEAELRLFIDAIKKNITTKTL